MAGAASKLGRWARVLGPSGPLRGGGASVLLVGAVAVALMSVVVALRVDVAIIALLAAAFAVLVGPLALLLVLGMEQLRLGAELDAAVGVAEQARTATARLDMLELVLADETRRPWDPTLLPWSLPELPSRPVVLLPSGDYHLPEMVELADELRRRGAQAVLACGRPHWARAAEGLAGYRDVAVREAPTPQQLVDSAGALVAMSDWGGYRPLVEAANAAGIPTFAKVEGACDYDDVDTGERAARLPYRTAATILGQGANDAERLPGPVEVVGSTRLERLWWAPPARPLRPLAVINLNFSYGVLTEARDTFITSAVAGCEAAGLPFVISLHPAEPARSVHPMAVPLGISRLLSRATVLVSRFSTAPFEAMARGVPFVYHNPHDEQVDTFRSPQGAFDVSTDATSLAAALRAQSAPGEEARARAAGFFGQQVNVRSDATSASRAADVVLASL